MKNIFFLSAIVALISFSSCNQKPNRLTKEEFAARMDSLRSDLLKSDIAFSKLSAEKGRNAAFIEYADSNATLLRPFSMPLRGKDSIIEMLSQHPDSLYKLTWIPIRAVVAHSGELGFTYGTYSLEKNNTEKEEGTYCTIWKKRHNGSWKFLLSTGNEGLEPGDRKEF